MKSNIDYYNILEFNKIKDMLSQYAVTDYARDKINEMCPFMNENQLKRAQNETNGARAVIDYLGKPHIPDTNEVKKLFVIIEKDGILFPEQLDRFIRFIASCRRLKTYLKKAEYTEKSIAYFGADISTLDDIYDEINRCICGNEINSEASKELADIRRQIDNTNTQIKLKLDEILKSKKQYCNDSFISIKNGHYTLPVKKEYKNQITGSVIATSSTGTTYFIEPSAAIKLTEKLNILKTEESIEKERILYYITALIHDFHTEIKLNIETAEVLDFAFAKGMLSSEMKGAVPNINTDRYIKIVKGRHPLLNRDECVPIDFEIGNKVNGIIITGPNTGGKTVALKLVGLFSVMSQCGLHIPCESADICMNSAVLCDIGDGQNISENLSTFSAHITNIVDIISSVSKETLILLDELGSGTDPAEGMGIAVAILEELRQKKCLFVATTHYAEVKSYAENATGLMNARMTFDKETLKPQYKLVIGEAGESCAFYIAKRLGFPARLLKYAYEQTYNTTVVSSVPDMSFTEIISDNISETNDVKTTSISTPKIEKSIVKKQTSTHALSFNIGDSVVVYPEKKIGIVYKPTDELGTLIVQVQGKKQKINHKRLHLKTPASKLYPPDYDFSIIFDTVQNRKARHSMDKKFSPDAVIEYDDNI